MSSDLYNKIAKKAYAACIHFCASIAVVLAVMALIYFVWYPYPLVDATGVLRIFTLIIIVDVCLGPLLTFVVYNEDKKELKRDILIILILQISALAYGIHSVSVSRPAYIVFAVDRFEIAYANDLTTEKLSEVKDPLFAAKHPLWKRPTWIAAHLPTDVEERNDMTFNSTFGGDDLAQIPKYYKNLNSAKEKINEKSKPVKPIKDSEHSTVLQKYLDSDKYGFLPLAGKVKDFSVIINKNSLAIEEILDIDPWK